MYSQNDLDDAVAAGALTADAARRAAQFHRRPAGTAVGRRRAISPDHRLQRHFRLDRRGDPVVRGWLDRPVDRPALGLSVDGDGPAPLAPLAVAATAWGLALFFTAKRRMALPSILLLLAFVGGVFATAASPWCSASARTASTKSALGGIIAAGPAAIAAGAAWFHWRRFRVPITVAAGAAAVARSRSALLIAVLGQNRREQQEPHSRLRPAARDRHVPVRDALGRFRPARVTRRRDVAFWLHLLAAPMIVHPVFTLLGLNDGNATVGEGLVVSCSTSCSG